MDARDDALVAAAEEVLRIRDVALRDRRRRRHGSSGRLEVEPGGVNVIPGRVRLTIDARAPDDERLALLLDALGIDPAGATPPTPLGGARGRAAGRDRRRGLPVIELASGAGHDAGVLARADVPSAMLFVRALNGGASHSPDELSSPEDVSVAIDVLTDALGGSRRADPRAPSGHVSRKTISCAPSQRNFLERAEVLVALDDRGEMVPGQLARLRCEVDVPVGEQELGLGDTAPGRGRSRPGGDSTSRSPGRARDPGRRTGSSPPPPTSGRG